MFQGAPGAENVISVKAIGHYEHEQEIVKKKKNPVAQGKRENSLAHTKTLMTSGH